MCSFPIHSILIRPQTVAVALFQIAKLRREAFEDLVSRARRSSTHAEQHRQQTAMNERLSLDKEQSLDETRPI